MLTNKRQNFHHSKLPELGEIVTLPLKMYGKVKAIVISFPLCDNVLTYSIGIHMCHIRRLDNNKIIHIAGHWIYNND